MLSHTLDLPDENVTEDKRDLAIFVDEIPIASSQPKIHLNDIIPVE